MFCRVSARWWWWLLFNVWTSFCSASVSALITNAAPVWSYLLLRLRGALQPGCKLKTLRSAAMERDCYVTPAHYPDLIIWIWSRSDPAANKPSQADGRRRPDQLWHLPSSSSSSSSSPPPSDPSIAPSIIQLWTLSAAAPRQPAADTSEMQRVRGSGGGERLLQGSSVTGRSETWSRAALITRLCSICSLLFSAHVSVARPDDSQLFPTWRPGNLNQSGKARDKRDAAVHFNSRWPPQPRRETCSCSERVTGMTLSYYHVKSEDDICKNDRVAVILVFAVSAIFNRPKDWESERFLLKKFESKTQHEFSLNVW